MCYLSIYVPKVLSIQLQFTVSGPISVRQGRNLCMVVRIHERCIQPICVHQESSCTVPVFGLVVAPNLLQGFSFAIFFDDTTTRTLRYRRFPTFKPRNNKQKFQFLILRGYILKRLDFLPKTYLKVGVGVGDFRCRKTSRITNSIKKSTLICIALGSGAEPRMR